MCYVSLYVKMSLLWQDRHQVANGSAKVRHFYEKTVCVGVVSSQCAFWVLLFRVCFLDKVTITWQMHTNGSMLSTACTKEVVFWAFFRHLYQGV